MNKLQLILWIDAKAGIDISITILEIDVLGDLGGIWIAQLSSNLTERKGKISVGCVEEVPTLKSELVIFQCKTMDFYKHKRRDRLIAR